MPSTAYIGLGANLGDPVQSLIDACRRLAALPYCQHLSRASLYWTAPLGYADQPRFVNSVVKMAVRTSMDELFADMQDIEKGLGRVREAHKLNAPRVIDLDLLLFDDIRFKSESLTVPHPRMLERRFVIEPLLELEPFLSIEQRSLAQIYQEKIQSREFQSQQIYRLGD